MKLHVLFAAIFAIIGAIPCHAIDPHRKMSQYVRDRWGTEQGFPPGSVYAITQTPDGYLWIGSEAGLLRFDGLNFSQIRDPAGSITLTSVVALVADKDGSLWIRLRDATLIRYRNGKFEYPPELSYYITATAKDNFGNLLAGEMQLGAFSYRGGAWHLLADASSLPRSVLLSIAQTKDGDIWMGTHGSGLFRLRGGRLRGQELAIKKGLPDQKINCLLPDGDRSLWVGTDRGMVRWDGTKLTPTTLTDVQVLTITRDRDANIWVGSDSRGLLRLNSDGVSALDAHQSGSGNAVTCIFEDREGNIWAGSENSIERLRDSTFVTYSGPEGLPTDGDNPVFVDSMNRTWFAPVEGGLWWLNGEQSGRILDDGLNRDVIYSIAGRANELWAGRQRGGLTRLRFDKGSPSLKTYTRADGLAQDKVYSVYETRDGEIWAGTLSGGVSRLVGGRFTTYTTRDGLASNSVASMLESMDGTMWFATPVGLNSLSNGKWRTFTAADHLPSENVNCLLQDSEGLLWVGTAAGLAFRGAGGFRTPPQTPAPLNDPIMGFAEDNFGSFWVATSYHILRVNRNNLVHGTLRDGDLREYGMSDGLRSVEGVKRHQSVVKDARGRIWFSLGRGISVVDPARLTSASALAIAHIESISADGAALPLHGTIRIPPGHHRMVFSYSGLSLSIPERVKFRYKLDGFDHSWSEPVTERKAFYTNLPQGPYRFRLIASTPDGLWSLREATLAFEVEPAFWRTWWFQIIAALAGVAAVSAAYRLRLQFLTKQLNVLFEERLAERTRIAQELHDTLLQGFISASMHVHVAASRLPEDARAKKPLARAIELMAQVIEEGRHAVRGLRSPATATPDLEHAFSQVQSQLLSEDGAAAEIEFRVVVEGQRRPLRPILREEVYRIGREALVNAFRHSAAKRIEIELTYSSQNLAILVRDDGRGIDPGMLAEGRDGHWGLSGMRERADRIGGRLRLWSSADRGTEIELHVPSRIAFEDHRSWLWKRSPGGVDGGT